MYDPLYNSDDPHQAHDGASSWALRPQRIRAIGRWQWPLLTLGDREPIVLAEHINGARRGVDLGYESRPYDAELYVPVFAVQSGEVMFCGGDHERLRDQRAARRHRVGDVLRPPLEGVSRRTPNPRSADAPNGFEPGDVIGYAAKAPIHVRFELVKWTADRGFAAVSPKPEDDHLDEARHPGTRNVPREESRLRR